MVSKELNWSDRSCWISRVGWLLVTAREQTRQCWRGGWAISGNFVFVMTAYTSEPCVQCLVAP